MNQADSERFNHFYQEQQKTLKLQGLSKKHHKLLLTGNQTCLQPF